MLKDENFCRQILQVFQTISTSNPDISINFNIKLSSISTTIYIFQHLWLSTNILMSNIWTFSQRSLNGLSDAISRKFPGRLHRAFEYPFRYHAVRGSGPGWTASGNRIPASWLGDDITTACQVEWRKFADPSSTPVWPTARRYISDYSPMYPPRPLSRSLATTRC